MGLRVNTNIASMNAQRNLGSVSTRLMGNFKRLSSGLRISTASDDAAGLGISERMRSQIRSYGAAQRNAQDGISLVQTAEGALNEVNSILNRMRELSIQAANGTLSNADRATLDTEYQELINEIDRISTTSTFNGVQLIDGTTTSLDLQAGINSSEVITVSLQDATATALSLSGLTVGTPSGASAALAVIDAAVDLVTTARGALGSAQNRLQSAISSIANASENLAAAESRIRDVDIATETADLTRNTIMQQAAVAMLAQANVQPQLALSLLQGR
ncbi:MAG: flagellin FliC [Planctomycetes bacterium]|nr:flagellin FliC [Planctomycetota bacterium]